jgi:predicted nucleic acid-binding protein
VKLFLDSSAFAKRFVEETGSQEVEVLCSRANELCLSVVCVPEIVSALNRRLREKTLTRREYAQTKQHLALDVRDTVVINLTPEVIRSSIEVLETAPVRALDALHIACALAWGAELFASADLRQIAAAKAVGLKTRFV